MDSIRVHKRKNGSMFLVLLLTFFCIMQIWGAEYQTYGIVEQEQSVSETGERDAPRSTEWLLEGHSLFGDAYRVPPRVTGMADVRCFFAEALLYGMLFFGTALIIRRFSCRMIPLWKNIVYIHQIDGKKGNALFVSC